jgi:uncharacterized protein involved in cysteine biosynthesis
MIGDFIKAVRQLLDPRFRKVFAISTLLTIGLLVAFYFAALWLLGFIPDLGFSVFGYEITFLDEALSWLAQGAVIWLLAVLMFPVAALFIGLFLEEIADAVEDKHYPHLGDAGRMTYWEILTDGLEFTLTLIGANMIGLIFYLFSGPLAPFIFLAINGYLLGRQYFELVGARRIGIAEAKRLRSRKVGRVWLAGILMAIPLSVPVLNVIVPVLGVASFTHMFHRLNGTDHPE